MSYNDGCVVYIIFPLPIIYMYIYPSSPNLSIFVWNNLNWSIYSILYLEFLIGSTGTKQLLTYILYVCISEQPNNSCLS